jgi:hypothetical protein
MLTANMQQQQKPAVAVFRAAPMSNRTPQTADRERGTTGASASSSSAARPYRVVPRQTSTFSSTGTAARRSRSESAESAAVEAAAAVLAAARSAAAAALDEADNEDAISEESEAEVVLTLYSLKPALCKPLAIKTMEVRHTNCCCKHM